MKTEPKRRGRPPKNTVTITATSKRRGRPPKSIKQTRETVKENLIFRSTFLRMQGEIARLNDKIANLEHQAIGYKAVVSYLENQLGLKGSQ